MCPSAGRLQGRRVADEEHGSFKWQCGYIAQHVQRQVCVRALEGRWVEGRRFGWLGLNDAVVFFLFLFFCFFICFLSLLLFLLCVRWPLSWPLLNLTCFLPLCPLCDSLLSSRYVLFHLVSEVKNCQRAYFYHRFPILHSDSGDDFFSFLTPALCRTLLIFHLSSPDCNETVFWSNPLNPGTWLFELHFFVPNSCMCGNITWSLIHRVLCVLNSPFLPFV